MLALDIEFRKNPWRKATIVVITGSEMPGKRVKNLADARFFAPEVCAGAQTSPDATEKSPARISLWRCLRTGVLRHALEERIDEEEKAYSMNAESQL